MKAVQTIFVLLVIALLSAQPMLAGSSCVMNAASPSCMPECSKSMIQMSADCPMAEAAIHLSYKQDCCRQAIPQTTARVEIPSAPKALRGEFVAAATQPPICPDPRHELSDTLLASASPPRYLLLQVFRI